MSLSTWIFFNARREKNLVSFLTRNVCQAAPRLSNYNQSVKFSLKTELALLMLQLHFCHLSYFPCGGVALWFGHLFIVVHMANFLSWWETPGTSLNSSWEARSNISSILLLLRCITLRNSNEFSTALVKDAKCIFFFGTLGFLFMACLKDLLWKL